MSSTDDNQNFSIGIIDEPNPRGGEDTLDISKHAKALITFIEYTATPMTVGIQGEWGSGKTSLLNAIFHHFNKGDDYKQIWINSWEHSLLTTPEEALIKIINEIISSLLEDETFSQSNKKETYKKIGKGILNVAANIVGGKRVGRVVDDAINSDSSNPIKALRTQLDEFSNILKDEGHIKKIIVYVDDLDRIEPKDAVQILELLKNIFSISNCVFILAIDYQVVVKGLEHKFGKRTDENEWEFRAFFDKIIQLPFMMPLNDYNISKYVYIIPLAPAGNPTRLAPTPNPAPVLAAPPTAGIYISNIANVAAAVNAMKRTSSNFIRLPWGK